MSLNGWLILVTGGLALTLFGWLLSRPQDGLSTARPGEVMAFYFAMALAFFCACVLVEMCRG